MTETTNDPLLPKTLVCLQRQQYDNIREEYITYKKKLSSRYGPSLRRPHHRPEESTVNRDQPLTQGPSRHQQDVYGGQTPLVAKINRSHTDEMRRMYPVQDVRQGH